MDLGTKRIGLAVGETGFGVASPRPALAASGTLARDGEAIRQIARKEQVTRIVVGLPVNEGDVRMANACRKLGEILISLGEQVTWIDESLTSVQAEARLIEAELKGAERHRKRDGEAACLILERFFNEETA